MDAKRAGTVSGESRVESIYRALYEAILAQELMPGTKLSEEAIGSFFGVSRTVVRAALNRLSVESLVELKQNRGAFVASPTLEESRQVFEARICIEKEIAAKLAEGVTEAQLHRLAEHVTQEEAALKAGEGALSIRLSGEFHLLAAAMAGNEVLARFLSELVSRTSLVLALHGRQGTSECGVEEHREILAALARRAPDAAVAAMAKHLGDVVARTHLGQNRAKPRKLTDILARYAS